MESPWHDGIKGRVQEADPNFANALHTAYSFDVKSTAQHPQGHSKSYAAQTLLKHGSKLLQSELSSLVLKGEWETLHLCLCSLAHLPLAPTGFQPPSPINPKPKTRNNACSGFPCSCPLPFAYNPEYTRKSLHVPRPWTPMYPHVSPCIPMYPHMSLHIPTYPYLSPFIHISPHTPVYPPHPQH